MSRKSSKTRRVKTIVMHRRPAQTKLEEICEHQMKKIDALETYIKKDLASMKTHIGIIVESLDGIDMNVLTLAAVTKEAYGQFSQMDAMFQMLDPKLDGKNLGERIDTEAVKATAKEWFVGALNAGFEEAQKTKAKHKEAQSEAMAQKAVLEQVKQQEKWTEEAIKKELDAAENGLSANGGIIHGNSKLSVGPSIPEGAEIFGG